MGCGGSVANRYALDESRATDTNLVSVSDKQAKSLIPPPPGRGSACRIPDGVAKLNTRDFQTLQVLAETQLSSIYCLLDRGSKRLVAGKRFLAGGRSRYPRQGLDREFEREVQMLHSLSDNPFVVNVVGVGSFGEKLIFLEFCAGGTLNNWLKRCPTGAKEAALQLLQAVEGLHSHCVCHLDLQPRHILFDDAGRLQLCDFALARHFDSAEESMVPANFGKACTNEFQAPELVSGLSCCGFRADLFSLGLLLQYIARSGPGWKVALGPFQALADREPSNRCSLASVRADAFPAGKGAGSAGVTQAEKNLFELDRILTWDPEANSDSPRPRVPTRKPEALVSGDQHAEKKPALHQRTEGDFYRRLDVS